MISQPEKSPYAESFSIFSPSIPILFTHLQRLWALDGQEVKQILRDYQAQNLLQIDEKNGYVLRSNAFEQTLARVPSEIKIYWNNRFLDGLNFTALPDEYTWRYIGYHLAISGQLERLYALLTDPVYLYRKAEATNTIALIEDCVMYLQVATPETEPVIRLLASVLMLSDSRLRGHQDIGAHLVGRLLDARAVNPAIHQLTDAILQTLPGAYPVHLENATRLFEQAGDFSFTHQVGEYYPEYFATSSNTSLKIRRYRRIGDNYWREKTEEAYADEPTIHDHLRFSPDGRWLTNIIPKQTIQIWDTETSLIVKTLLPPEPIYKVAFNSDRSKLIGVSDEKRLCIWDTSTDSFSFVSLQGELGVLPQLIVAGSQERIYLTERNMLYCYEIMTGKRRFQCQFTSPEYRIGYLQLSLDGRFLMTHGATPRGGVEYHIFSAETGELLLNTSSTEQDGLRILEEYPSFFPNQDGKLPLQLMALEDGGEDEEFFIFDAISRRLDINYLCSVSSGYGRYIDSIATSPCSPLLAIRDTGGQVGIFRYSEGNLPPR